MPGGLADTVGLGMAGLLAAAAAATAWQVPRSLVISHRGGVIDCALRVGASGTWRHGVAAYERDELCWYASPGLRLRADVRFDRAALRIVHSRPPTQAEAAGLGPDRVIAECAAHAQAAGLALSEAALTGMLAWLEASPTYYPAPD